MAHLSFASPLGPLTIAETDGALTVIDFATRPDGRETPLLAQARTQILAYLDGTRRTFDLALAPAGTDFQRRVWCEMQAIPYGETRRYGDLARRLASAPRAVGGACGRNPLPIVIPCHRVLASTGLGGYSGGQGLETKIALLRLEGAPAIRSKNATTF